MFFFAALRIDTITWEESDDIKRGFRNPKKLFYAAFSVIAFVYLFVLFFVKYPGLIEADTITQFYECRTGEYTNMNPLYSTLVIKPFVTVGMALFHNMNACAAMYFTAQAIFVAFSFSCVVKMLAEMKAPVWLMVCAILFYALMPYHIMFSIGHSKDVLFSVFVMLFCVVLFRILKEPNPSLKWYIYLFICSVGFCVMRNNGILAFLFFIPVYSLSFGAKDKKILLILISSIVLSFCLTRPLLRVLGISQSDWVESCSLPTQQVARAVIEHNDLSADEIEVLNTVMDVAKIPQSYNAGLSDPLKSMIRETMRENPESTSAADFLKLWVRLGLRHPISYAKAFIDLTCGYWNSGYDAAPWCNFIYNNSLGLHLTYPVPILNMLFDRYIGLFDDIMTLQLMVCTGFFVWMYLISLTICLIRKDKTGSILCAPVLCVVLTLLLGVPVACDLRYIYCAFCTLPFVLAVSTRKQL